MVANSDAKQYWNNRKNDKSLFSATNQERPYEQLLHNCLFYVLQRKYPSDEEISFSSWTSIWFLGIQL